ncbi:MAG TPA: ABC transporter ATP-binding protein [Puia sp.]|jgi:ABC-2 type transport system ATP-binding protein|nr:ABC transporter ATP-binding protein [Puia sp.]
MITINKLTKAYNGKVVVNIPTLDIKEGELLGLVGNNGAGKTTLFRLLLDLVRADAGEVFSKGQPVSTTEEWKSYTAAYLDEGFLIGYLTPEEYFYFVGNLHGVSRSNVDQFLRGLDDFFAGSVLKTGKYIRDLSKGNQFKTGIAACLLADPELVILDEPFANLDPSSQMRLIRMLKDVCAKKRTTVLISSHDLNHVTDVCHRILLMEKGRIIKDTDTTADTLQELEAYFQV